MFFVSSNDCQLMSVTTTDGSQWNLAQTLVIPSGGTLLTFPLAPPRL